MPAKPSKSLAAPPPRARRRGQKIHEQSQTLAAAVTKLNEAAEAHCPTIQHFATLPIKSTSRSTDLASLSRYRPKIGR